jgi:hypothetical protein
MEINSTDNSIKNQIYCYYWQMEFNDSFCSICSIHCLRNTSFKVDYTNYTGLNEFAKNKMKFKIQNRNYNP